MAFYNHPRQQRVFYPGAGMGADAAKSGDDAYPDTTPPWMIDYGAMAQNGSPWWSVLLAGAIDKYGRDNYKRKMENNIPIVESEVEKATGGQQPLTSRIPREYLLGGNGAADYTGQGSDGVSVSGALARQQGNGDAIDNWRPVSRLQPGQQPGSGDAADKFPPIGEQKPNVSLLKWEELERKYSGSANPVTDARNEKNITGALEQGLGRVQNMDNFDKMAFRRSLMSQLSKSLSSTQRAALWRYANGLIGAKQQAYDKNRWDELNRSYQEAVANGDYMGAAQYLPEMYRRSPQLTQLSASNIMNAQKMLAQQKMQAAQLEAMKARTAAINSRAASAGGNAKAAASPASGTDMSLSNYIAINERLEKIRKNIRDTFNLDPMSEDYPQAFALKLAEMPRSVQNEYATLLALLEQARIKGIPQANTASGSSSAQDDAPSTSEQVDAIFNGVQDWDDWDETLGASGAFQKAIDLMRSKGANEKQIESIVLSIAKGKYGEGSDYYNSLVGSMGARADAR